MSSSSAPIRIALATPNLHPDHGGPAYSVTEIGRHLALAGAEPVFISAKFGPEPPPGKKGGVLDLLGVDVVHNFGTWTPFNHLVAVAARGLGHDLVACPMGMLEPWALRQKRFKKRLGLLAYQRRDLDRAAVLHATCTMEAENLRALGVRTEIAVIPHGIDLPPWTPLPEADGKAIRTLLFLSRINPKKGLIDLVDAWAALRPEGWRVVIAGPDEGGHRAEVERRIERHRLGSHFEVVGPVYGAAKRELFGAADLFVLPTYSENFGLVVPEALAHGLPVITTTGTPWRELLAARCGFWVEPGIEPLKQVLSQALSLSPQTLREMGERGRAHVESKYAWPPIIQLHMHLYGWMLGRRPRPAFMFAA